MLGISAYVLAEVSVCTQQQQHYVPTIVNIHMHHVEASLDIHMHRVEASLKAGLKTMADPHGYI